MLHAHLPVSVLTCVLPCVCFFGMCEAHKELTAMSSYCFLFVLRAQPCVLENQRFWKDFRHNVPIELCVSGFSDQKEYV